MILVPHECDRQPVPGVALAVSEDAVVLVLAVRAHPRAVVLLVLERDQQVAGTDAGRGHAQEAAVVVGASAEADKRPVKDVEVVDVSRSCRGKVAVLRVVRAFAKLHAAHELRDEKVRIRVALRMGMRRHVDGNAGNGLPEVEAVVEVEPTQVVLVGLALTAVLADDHAWNRFQDLGSPVGRTGRPVAPT